MQNIFENLGFFPDCNTSVHVELKHSTEFAILFEEKLKY